MLTLKFFNRFDFRMIVVILLLMGVSLLVVSSFSINPLDEQEEGFWTPLTKVQLQWFFLGWGVYLFFASLDYSRLRDWTWIFYGGILIALIGVFFSPAIGGCHRWYKIPFVNYSLQPSEYAKLAVVMALSWFLERCQGEEKKLTTCLLASLIVIIPFILIMKEPDLGTSLTLLPVMLVLFYLAQLSPRVIQVMAWTGGLLFLVVGLIFTGVLMQEAIRPYAMLVLKEYQFDRLDPYTYHQRAAQMAIAIGGIYGTGWRKSDFTGGGWLPTPTTDSVFSSFGEEFGLLGLFLLLALFYALLYFCYQVTLVAKDTFGRLLAAGISTYLAMHVLFNSGMMIGFLPITGVPLILVTYGGSSIVSTMMALGILQSIYSRRFMF